MLTPFVCIPTGSGEDQPAPVGTDGDLEFAAQVVDNGPAVSDANLVITLPAGLRLESDEDDPVTRLEDWWSSDSDGDGTPLDCTSNQDGSVTTCATGSVPAGANFLVLADLTAQDDAVAGTSAALTVALQSAPDPGAFPTTSVPATVDFVGTAHLQVHLTPATANVTVGKSLTLTATVHNVGPNQAVEAATIGLVDPDGDSDDPPFLITNSQPFPGGYSGSTTDSDAAFLLRARPTETAAAKTSTGKTAAAETPSPIGFWPIGTIAVGGTATVQVVVKAEYKGAVELDFEASSADESCDDPTAPGCENDATAELSAVAAVTTTTTTASATTSTVTASPTTASTSTAALPNTGFEPTPWLGSAAAVILLGIALMVLGAPRRRVCGGGRYR